MKKRFIGLTLLAAPILLTSCSTIRANFINSDEKLTNVNEPGKVSVTIDHNTQKVIFDAIRDGGSFASDAKTLLTNEIAKAVIGDFKVARSTTSERKYEIVLEGYDGKDDATKTAFIESHDAYKNWASSAYTLKFEEGYPSKADFEKRINVVKEIIETEILKSIWNEANSSSYKRNNRFYEMLFAKSLCDKLYKIKDANGNAINDVDFLYQNPDYETHYLENSAQQFMGFTSDASALVTDKGFTNGLLIDYTYTTETEEGKTKIANALHIPYYVDYINDTIMPTILNNLLVEQYIIEQQYSAIGVSQKRKVNYVKIENNTSRKGQNFMINIIKNGILAHNYHKFDSSAVGPVESTATLTTSEVFDFAQEAWKAIPGSYESNPEMTRLITSTYGAIKDENPSIAVDGHKAGGYIDYVYDVAGNAKTFTYFKDTGYHDLVKKFSTLTHDPETNNSSNYSTFTSIDGVNYAPSVGFEIKTDELRVQDFTTYAWQTKDESSLPDAAKSKLYSYGFAYDWGEALSMNASNKAYRGSYIYQVEQVDGSYKSYLMNDKYDSLEKAILWQDGDNFYIIEIEDIVNPGVMGVNSDAKASEKAAIEAKARKTAYSLASGSTYTTSALTHFLEKCDLKFHDQSVYDYFVNNFPKLFED